MDKQTIKFINDSRDFRGEPPYNEHVQRSSKSMFIASIVFLVIFVTGCTATYSTSHPVKLKRQTNTEEPK